MNKVFRVIWNHSLKVWQPVSEIAKSRAKTKSRAQQLSSIAAGALLLMSTQVWAGTLPNNGNVTLGSGSIATNGNHMTINQSTHKLAIDWQSFNIGQGNSVTFQQPDASAIALNRVIGADVSHIQGALNANGQVFLINPNGILFSTNAQVNVGALVASTLTMSNEEFAAGNYRFRGTSSNAIINQGNIKAADGGYIAMIAAKIENSGTLTAHRGTVLMGAGSTVLLDMGGPVKLEVKQSTIDALIEQGGAIKADGGYVYLTAKAAGDLASTVINHTGITEAQTLATGEKGQIYLMGDMDNGGIEVAGTLDASAPNGGDGGFVETSAAIVDIKSDLKVTTLSQGGKTGTWLIDPTDIEIVAGTGGDFSTTPTTSSSIGVDTLVSNLANNNITVQTPVVGEDAGNITVSADIVWDANTKLTLGAINNIYLNAKIENENTTGGGVYFDAGNASEFDDNGKVVIHNVEQLQWMNTALNGTYELGSNIDASVTSTWNPVDSMPAGFVPIGDDITPFTGNLDGLGRTVDGLFINRQGTDGVGLFGVAAGSSIANIGLTDVNVTGGDFVGGLAGAIEESTISESYVTGNVTGNDGVGGLASVLYLSTISESYVTGNVTGKAIIGGLASALYMSTISESYAIGTVTGNRAVGGLVSGAAFSKIENSYAQTTIIGADKESSGETHTEFGGLVGRLVDSSVADSYAVGQIMHASDAERIGGLIGINMEMDETPVPRLDNDNITNSFWDVQASGHTVSAGGIGKTTAEMRDSSTYGDWDTTIWSFVDGTTVEGYGLSTPYLTHVTTDTHRNEMLSTLFAGGWGNADAAYTISDWTQLQNINIVANKGFHFLLSNDIGTESAGYNTEVGTFVDGVLTLANDGHGWSPITPYVEDSTMENSVGFMGNFDGGEHTIDGLATDQDVLAGLFGTIKKGSVENLRLTNVSVNGTGLAGALVGNVVAWYDSVRFENITIDGGSVEGASAGGLLGFALGFHEISILNVHTDVAVVGQNGVGGVAGMLFMGAKVDKSSSAGTVTAGESEWDDSHAGGLIGATLNSTISNSYSTATVTATGNGVGGLVGELIESDIDNSYATGSVTGVERVGGLVGSISKDGGDVSGRVRNSYAVGAVSGTVDAGGLIGTEDDSVLSNNFWNTETAGTGIARGVGSAESDPDGVVGKTTAEMQDILTFVDWNISLNKNLGNMYPQLAWRQNSGDSESVWVIGKTPTEIPARIPTPVQAAIRAAQSAVNPVPYAAPFTTTSSNPLPLLDTQVSLQTRGALQVIAISTSQQVADASDKAVEAAITRQLGSGSVDFGRVFVVDGGIRMPDGATEE